jgi:AraC-like DNA-binding protein
MAVRLPRWSGQIITGAADVRLIAFAWPDSAIAALGPLAVGLTAPRTLYGRSSVELAWRAAGELRGGDRYSPNAIELFATGVAIGLARSLLHGPRGEPALAARVRRRIEQDPSSELSLARLAREFGCTPSHLGRTFLRTYGMSPTEFRIRLRVEAARSLLATTSRPVSELARTLGFHDASHFARHFRRLSGQSPLAFRTRQRHAASVPKQARSYRTESPDAP